MPEASIGSEGQNPECQVESLLRLGVYAQGTPVLPPVRPPEQCPEQCPEALSSEPLHPSAGESSSHRTSASHLPFEKVQKEKEVHTQTACLSLAGWLAITSNPLPIQYY
ncbi:uncharacterized protein PG986_004307 [Apiospora aurea]|uniref:Uncharacterized protein n=1 Tax=Apiospora aurea TaxID=335848 RepID=A0ABR1QMF7_9PEZI